MEVRFFKLNPKSKRKQNDFKVSDILFYPNTNPPNTFSNKRFKIIGSFLNQFGAWVDNISNVEFAEDTLDIKTSGLKSRF